MAALFPTPRVAGSITSDCSLATGSDGQLTEGTQLAINCEEVKVEFFIYLNIYIYIHVNMLPRKQELSAESQVRGAVFRQAVLLKESLEHTNVHSVSDLMMFLPYIHKQLGT